MSDLSNWEKNFLAKTRNFKTWSSKNPWFKYVATGVVGLLLWKATTLGVIVLLGLGLGVAILWNIMNKA